MKAYMKTHNLKMIIERIQNKTLDELIAAVKEKKKKNSDGED